MATVDLGKVAIKHKGTWNSSATYEPLDYVLSHIDGCGYIALVSNTNVTPGSDATKWALSVSSPRVTLDNAQPAGGMLPNVYYSLGTLSGAVTFTVNTSGLDSTILNHWMWSFDTGATAPTITWPEAITAWNAGAAPSISANKHYEVSLIGGIAAFMES